MLEYEIAVTLRVKDYFYTEKNAASSVSGHFTTFAEAFPAFCTAVSFGFTVKQDNLNARLCGYRKKAEDVDKDYRLTLIRHECDFDTIILENLRSDSDYEGESTVVSCNTLDETELGILARHGLVPEEDSFGSYFELYPVNDLLYDLSDSTNGALDPTHKDLTPLLKEYACAHDLIINEIDPSEDGYFCPGDQTKEECFSEWGSAYGYLDDEQDIFTDSLIRYKHGYVLEFKD